MSVRLVLISIALFFCKPCFPQGAPDTTVYDIVEKMPGYPGGQTALLTYLMKHLKVSHEDKEHWKSQIAFQFVVEKDGSLSNFILLRPEDMPAKLKKKFRKLLMAGPKWTPGKQDGRDVRVRVGIPIIVDLRSMIRGAGKSV